MNGDVCNRLKVLPTEQRCHSPPHQSRPKADKRVAQGVDRRKGVDCVGLGDVAGPLSRKKKQGYIWFSSFVLDSKAGHSVKEWTEQDIDYNNDRDRMCSLNLVLCNQS